MVLRIPIKRINNSSDKLDFRCSFFIISYYVLQVLNLLFHYLLINNSVVSLIIKLFLSLLLLSCVPVIVARSKKIFIYIEFLFILLFLLSYLFFEPSTSITDIAINELLVFIPLGICAYSINDYSLFISYLRASSIVTHILLIILCFVAFNSVESTYDMTIGYTLVLQTIIMTDWFFDKKNILRLIIILIDLSLIIVIGSRGPIICLVSYILLRLITNSDINKIINYVLLSFISIIVIILFLPDFTSWFSAISNKPLNIESRTLRLLFTGNILYDSGRSEYIQYSLNNIRNRPLTGYGLTGGWLNDVYPHNFIIEILLSFGVPIGLLVLALVIFVVIQGFSLRDSFQKKVFLIFLTYSIQLLVSGSFLESSSLFIFLLVAIKPILPKEFKL